MVMLTIAIGVLNSHSPDTVLNRQSNILFIINLGIPLNIVYIILYDHL